MGVSITMIDMAEFYVLIGISIAYVVGLIIYDRVGKKDD